MSKYSGKKECYEFCAMELKAYLPGHECVSIYYLRDLIQGKKTFVRVSDLVIEVDSTVKADKVVNFYCPFYKGLTIEMIYNHSL